jgi:uncharacterized protein (UPF0262 family)
MTAGTALAASRIIDVVLGSQSGITRSADIEIERHRALADLLHDNSFRLTTEGAEGPYRLTLSTEGELFLLDVLSARTRQHVKLAVPRSLLEKYLHDYATIGQTVSKLARTGQIKKLALLDAERRELLDSAASILVEALENKALIDKMTARRLFSLLYVLHMRGAAVPMA